MANGNGNGSSQDLSYSWPQDQQQPTSRLPVMSPQFVFGTNTAPAGAGQPGFDWSGRESQRDLARVNAAIKANLPQNQLAPPGATAAATLVPGGAVTTNPLAPPLATTLPDVDVQGSPMISRMPPAFGQSPDYTPGTVYATPPGHVDPSKDPDVGVMVKGTNIPVSVAKQFIRSYEPGPDGYNAAWGMKGGLPANVAVDQYGFPTKEAYPGMPIGGNLYGGRYAGQNSSAYGMYQFERSTWQGYARQMKAAGIDITDNSPESQEKMASWVLANHGMGDWLPYNANLNAAIQKYTSSGQMPNLYSPPGYTGGAGGPMFAGDVVPGTNYEIGGRLAFAPPRPSMTGPTAPEGGNVAQAGGPSGEPGPSKLTPAEIAFQNMIKGQGQQGRGYQMLALLGLLNQGRKIVPASGYNPANADPTIRPGGMPMAARVEGGYAMGRVPGQLWY